MLAIGVGLPVFSYNASVLFDFDSTHSNCFIVSLSGYPDLWARPPVVLSFSIGYNIPIGTESILRPAFGLGDGGFGVDGAFAVTTVHCALWAEVKVSKRMSMSALLEKRFDIAYRYWSPVTLTLGINIQ
jgi:hypothetical protein